MQAADIRRKFLDFFHSKGHTIVPSAPLVPHNDPTLLFTNSGMVQFKDVFLGQDKRNYQRATTAQRCLRAGGKHNDLENVGYTARHHTFFEMLGNFSFGDYFKQDAINYAWTLLTEVYQLPKEKLWVTVYQNDDEAYDIWSEYIGVPQQRIVRIGDNKGAPYASDNFWQMADTGPCGPCSEIFYDHGEDVAGGPPGSVEADGDRYIEVWNLVFMQFNRDGSGTLNPLPRPCVDTGMGLERLAAILQGVHSNYEIDSFQYLIHAAAKLTNTRTSDLASLRVIADHLRACCFLIVDGVLPSNEGRGYVLRRILRRALRHGHQLSQTQAFFYQLVPALVAQMQDAYPELAAKQDFVSHTLQDEEMRFGETLTRGMQLLDQALMQTKNRCLSGDQAFRLYDTFGFPIDLTADVCRERGFSVDMSGFEQALAEQRQQAREAHQFIGEQGIDYQGKATQFSGYQHTQDNAKVVALYVDGQTRKVVESGGDVWVMLDQTPFYAQSGGQVGDSGTLQSANAIVKIHDTRKLRGDVHIHIGELVQGVLQLGDSVTAQIDQQRRDRITRHHSATHLIHLALRKTLGDHVEQKGSLVCESYTRFDFQHPQAMSAEEISAVEDFVNFQIMTNEDSNMQLMSHSDALKHGAVALFGERYGDTVRVVDIGASRELCGGTHVKRSGDIGLFKIVSESAIAAGVRRVVAVTGDAALDYVRKHERSINHVAQLLKSTPDDVVDKVKQLVTQSSSLHKQLLVLRKQVLINQIETLPTQVLGGHRWLHTRVDAEFADLRDVAEQVQKKNGGIVILAARLEDKVQMAVAVDKTLSAQIPAHQLAAMLGEKLHGKGGGKPQLAMAGGSKVNAIDEAFHAAFDFAQRQLAVSAKPT